ncbi:Ohr family peroxiredoxin [Streptomyces sp. NPDC058434]|uniref:Ohr family peroxiredoxin n=1 Tax=Streptomyces sp. NPDC058434 TaxID=3346498 RepID=UPI00364ADABB
MNVLFTEVATVRVHEARTVSTSGQIDLPLAPHVALGGNGQGTNPEDIFAAGYAACFSGMLAFIAGQQKIDVSDVSVTAEVSFVKEDDGGFGIAATIRVALPEHLQGEVGAGLVVKTHAACPYSKAISGNVPVEVVVV